MKQRYFKTLEEINLGDTEVEIEELEPYGFVTDTVATVLVSGTYTSCHNDKAGNDLDDTEVSITVTTVVRFGTVKIHFAAAEIYIPSGTIFYGNTP